jgi:trehalose 6-phosphate phosphatase
MQDPLLSRLWMEISCQTHAFLFDFDGTLVDIQQHPDLVYAPAELLDHLGKLHALTQGAIAIVTGRQLCFIDRHFNALCLAGAGIHGLEVRLETGGKIMRSGEPGLLDCIRPKAIAWVQQNPAVKLEDKGLSIALHYRDCPELISEVITFATFLASLSSHSLTVQHGHFVTEVRLRGLNKGNAVDLLMQGAAFAGRTPVFFGDDKTDESAFAAVQATGGLGVFVGEEPENTIATGRIQSPAAVRRLVAMLSRQAAVMDSEKMSTPDSLFES